MFCIYCGKPTEGNSNICADCAAARSDGYGSDIQTEDTFQINTPKKPQKGKGGIIALIAAIAVVAVAAVVLALNWNSITGSFSTPQEHLAYVEEKALEDQLDTITDAYGNYLENLNIQNNAMNTEVRVQLGDDILDLLESSLYESGIPFSVDWLRDITVAATVRSGDDRYQTSLGIGLGSNRILTADMIVDVAGDGLWIGVPELHEDYLHIDSFAEMTGMSMSEAFGQGQMMTQEMLQMLPTEDELNAMLNKYLGLVIHNIENVETGSDTLTVGGISEEFTTLTATIYEKDVLNIAKTILSEFKEDDDVLETFADMVEYYIESNAGNEYIVNPFTGEYNLASAFIGMDAKQILMEAINEALAELEANLTRAAENNYLVLTTYINDEEEICGRKLVGSDDGELEDILHFSIVHDGDAFALEAVFGDELTVTGKGTEKDDQISGEFTVLAEGQHLLDLHLTNAGEAGGTYRLIPSETLLEEVLYELGIDGASILSTLDITLEMEIKSTDAADNMSARLMNGSKLVVGVTLSSYAGGNGDVELPANGVDVLDDAASMEWFSQLDFDRLLENLRTAGVPSELVSTLDYLLASLLQSIR